MKKKKTRKCWQIYYYWRGSKTNGGCKKCLNNQSIERFERGKKSSLIMLKVELNNKLWQLT